MITNATHQPAQQHASGTWKLQPGQAMTLRPRQNGELLIVHGAVWATLNGPHEGLGSGPLGDLHLQPGERLQLNAGRQVVLEPIVSGQFGQATTPEVNFSWEYTPASWKASVAEPADDLTRALHEARVAFARLVRGLVAWSGERIAPAAARP
ncbi:DUF2917 domain-containing protein [Ottowia thiooxydans]|uniref:DUF2917 domain-containing protein n=1 Tax=Ottowia thiooxydans TaxID=219182 RepID=A0ABV2QFN1_9BURK